MAWTATPAKGCPRKPNGCTNPAGSSSGSTRCCAMRGSSRARQASAPCCRTLMPSCRCTTSQASSISRSLFRGPPSANAAQRRTRRARQRDCCENGRVNQGATHMEMTGEQLIPLPQAEVWRGLIDPQVLKASIPGCEAIEKVADNEFKVKLVLSDIKAPDSYSLAFEGSGGAAGFAKGGARVSLSPEGRGTRLRYSTKASVGGKLAQVGSRLIDGVAAKMADDFF